MKFYTDKARSKCDLAYVKRSSNKSGFRINWFTNKLGSDKTWYILNYDKDLLAFVLVLIESNQIFHGATIQNRCEICYPPQGQRLLGGPCIYTFKLFLI